MTLGQRWRGPRWTSVSSLPRKGANKAKRRPGLEPGRDPGRSPNGREPGGRGRGKAAPGLLIIEPRCHQRPAEMQEGGGRIAGEGSIPSPRRKGAMESSGAQGHSAGLGLA